MSQTLRLHYAPDNASLCVRLALEAFAIPHELVPVDRASRAQKSPAYLRINPNGLIPALETAHGPLFETAAILLWLSDIYPGLMPPPDSAERGEALKWLFWMSNTLQATERLLFHPDDLVTTEAAKREVQRGLREAVNRQLTVIELSGGDWIDAAEPSALTAMLAPLLRWPALYPDGDGYNLADYPRLHRFAQVFEAHDFVVTVAASEGLGTTPFSAPSYPNPPHGSAT
jgi:glutathione S-transferase